MIAIIDYGLGNLASVKNMLKKIGADAIITSNKNEILKADKLLLPGVGAFDEGMKNLKNKGFIEVIQDRAEAGTPLLGICLGMQMLTLTSDEGSLPGLGLVDAITKRFDKKLKVKIPHMGWNYTKSCKDSVLAQGLDSTSRFYFVHSFRVECRDTKDILFKTDYGGATFVSGFARDNILGVQFHPEKSHRYGMQLLNNFKEM